MPRQIVSPLVIEIVIQKYGREETKIQGAAGFELVNDLPRAESCFVRIGPGQVEVVLVESGFGEELGAGGEGFQVIELVFDEAVNGFDIALEGVGGGRDALMLTIAESGGEAGAGAVGLKRADEFSPVVGLPGQMREINAAAGQVSLNASGEAGAGGRRAAGSKGEELKAAADFAGGVLHGGQIEGLGLGPVARDVV